MNRVSVQKIRIVNQTRGVTSPRLCWAWLTDAGAGVEAGGELISRSWYAPMPFFIHPYWYFSQQCSVTYHVGLVHLLPFTRRRSTRSKCLRRGCGGHEVGRFGSRRFEVLSSRVLTNYSNMTDTQGPDTHRLVHKPSQAVQKGQISHPPNPGAPGRAVPRARPQQAMRRRVLSVVREPLSAARTMLADFVNSLLDDQRLSATPVAHT